MPLADTAVNSKAVVHNPVSSDILSPLSLALCLFRTDRIFSCSVAAGGMGRGLDPFFLLDNFQVKPRREKPEIFALRIILI